MNIFVIPSWYPTQDFPSTGIFFKEQSVLLARHRPDYRIGISLWGSHEPKLWLKVSQPLTSFIKYFSKPPLKPADRLLEPNCVEFFHPAYTWTRRIKKGNIEGIIRANEQNLERYTAYFGKPDVIHAHVAYPGGYVAMAMSRKYGIPYVVTEHMSPFPLPSFRNDFKKALLPPLLNADRVLSVGENLSEDLSSYGISSKVVPNFIDLDFFQTVKTENSELAMFALGRLVDQKGFDRLLHALANLKTQSWKLKIGGKGPVEKNLRKKSYKLEIQQRVDFIGELTQSQVADHMKTCDFFVFPSRPLESFGIVLIEAMACGKPVVYTRCGGLTSSLPEFVGIGCEPTVENLADAIAKMLKEYQTFDQSAIRKFVEDNYSVEVVSKQLESIYKSVISGTKSSSKNSPAPFA